MTSYISFLLNPPLIFGLCLLLIGTFITTMPLFLRSQTALPVNSWVFGLTAGAGMMAGVYQLHLAEPVLLALALVSLGNYIEGLAAFRLYQKISYGLRNKSTNLPGKGLIFKIVGMAIIFFIVIISGIILSVIVSLPWFSLPIPTGYTLLWSLFTILYTSFSLSIKLFGINEELPKNLVIGLIILVAGAQVYSPGGIMTELLIGVLGTVATSIGFWVGAKRLYIEDPIFRTAIKNLGG